MPDIRKARIDDAKALALFAETAFRASFGAMNTAEDMDAHCRSTYGEAIQAAEIADPGAVTFVGEEQNRLIGYAQLRWGKAPDCVVARSPAEIQRIYVAKDWHGKGIAQALMQACIDEAVQRGSDAVWLGVWERNPRAIAFYGKSGFVEVGDHTFTLGGDPQRDVVMLRSVG